MGTVNESMHVLSEMFKTKDWFYDIEVDSLGRIVLYSKWMNLEILTTVPDKVENHTVLVHFAQAKSVNKDQFVQKIVTSFPLNEVEEIISVESIDMIELTAELDRLEKICGSHILQDIFYEVHDATNAVTNLSVKFPDVRESMEELYEKYGFDIIYDELDG